MALGDRSAQYSQLLAQMLAAAQSKPQAYPGHKIMATGGAPIVADQNFTEGGVNLGGILKLLGKHPDQMSAQRDQLNKDAQMTQLWVGTNMNEKQLDQYYSQPPVQELLDKFEKAGATNIWVNPDTNRKEFLPVSPEMLKKLTGQKPFTKEQWLAQPPGTPGRENLIQGEQAIRPKNQYDIIPPNVVQDQFAANTTLTRKHADEAGAGAVLKGEQAKAVPSLIDLRKSQAGTADATTDYLKGMKGQPANLAQKDKELTQKTVNAGMKDFSKTFTEFSKIDRYGVDPQDYIKNLGSLTAATIGAVNQFKQYDAKPEIAGVVGRFIVKMEEEVNTTKLTKGKKLDPNDLQRLQTVRNSVFKMMLDSGKDKTGNTYLPMHQIQELQDLVVKLNTILGPVQ